ncbi:MAG: DUF4149 domain-containing protein [Bryobacteraceae bacterium]|nr:DUF4149 domain-containing protein [Bryobacteraceae bacterium]
MHTRRLACFLLGLWIGGSIFMGTVAVFSFRSVDRMLDEPLSYSSSAQAREMIARLGGTADAGMFLRHHSAELNRTLFEIWGWTQLVLGFLLLLGLIFGSGGSKPSMALAALMLILTAAAHFFVMPPIVGLGREVDFVPRDAASPIRTQLSAWHSTYSTLEGIKLALGCGLAFMLVVSSHRRRSNGED